MYKQIMVPVDLAHLDALEKALQTAADLSKHFGCPVCYVGVTAPTPGEVAHTPQEFAAKLDRFGEDQAARHGHVTTTWPITSHDPTADLDETLLDAVEQSGADLVVMATHLPNVADYIWPSNGGKIASHSNASVFLVRGA